MASNKSTVGCANAAAFFSPLALRFRFTRSRAFATLASMLVKSHAVASTLAAGGVYLASGSRLAAAVTIGSGILVDIDHLLEYTVEHGFSLDIRRFFRLVYQARYQRVFYLLHSWEWFAALTAVAWANGWSDWSLGLMTGYGLHLAMDQMGNRGTAWSYFLLWRWRQGFDHLRCFPGHARCLAGKRRDKH